MIFPLALLVATLLLSAQSLFGQLPEDLDDLSDAGLYEAACANCHGPDGRGLQRDLVGFEEPLPNFTDCDFASREPDADWIAIVHEGGPVRGFSRMMPAFGGALSVEQIARAVRHIRTFCGDPSWPRGALNLPRALLTEKAYPEDEWVAESGVNLEGDGAVENAFVWEQRFGPRSQLEVVIPYSWVELPDAAGAPGATHWVSGLGDVVLGLKHALYHSHESGTIFSVGGEAALPTGEEGKGLGAEGARTEGFLSFGQILPADGFLQAQTGAELPLYEGGETEAFGRLALGRTFTAGPWGRSFTPFVELQGKGELEGGSVALDVVPQMQVSLSARQHVLVNVGVLVPATQTAGRSVQLQAYLLLDWFDGSLFEGW